MSVCIARDGEFSEHEAPMSPSASDMRFVCARCFVFDAGAALEALAAAEDALDRIRKVADRALADHVKGSTRSLHYGFYSIEAILGESRG